MRNTRGKLLSALMVVAAAGAAALLPQAGESQGVALPKSTGAALRSGWQIAHFSAAYAAPPSVSGRNEIVSTQFGSDEVHYYVMHAGSVKYQPWKHECMAIG